jgi:hypothetical protein
MHEVHLSNIYGLISYFTKNALHLIHKDKLVNAVYKHNRCLLRESYGTKKKTLLTKGRAL